MPSLPVLSPVETIPAVSFPIDFILVRTDPDLRPRQAPDIADAQPTHSTPVKSANGVYVGLPTRGYVVPGRRVAFEDYDPVAPLRRQQRFRRHISGSTGTDVYGFGQAIICQNIPICKYPDSDTDKLGMWVAACRWYCALAMRCERRPQYSNCPFPHLSEFGSGAKCRS
jgi:hypothetical protein